MLLGGFEGEERFLRPGKAPHQQTDPLGQRSFRGFKKRAVTHLQQAGQSDSYTEGLSHSPVYPSLRHALTSVKHWAVELGVWRADQGEDCY